ncbi:MAG TPA: hypothetical protein V6C76_03795 [Drouetiella sp.]
MTRANSNNERIQSGDDGNGHDAVSSDRENNIQKSNKQVELDFCLFEKGPGAAKRFNDLIAKTLKLNE